MLENRKILVNELYITNLIIGTNNSLLFIDHNNIDPLFAYNKNINEIKVYIQKLAICTKNILYKVFHFRSWYIAMDTN